MFVLSSIGLFILFFSFSQFLLNFVFLVNILLKIMVPKLGFHSDAIKEPFLVPRTFP